MTLIRVCLFNWTCRWPQLFVFLDRAVLWWDRNWFSMYWLKNSHRIIKNTKKIISITFWKIQHCVSYSNFHTSLLKINHTFCTRNEFRECTNSSYERGNKIHSWSHLHREPVLASTYRQSLPRLIRVIRVSELGVSTYN